MNTDQLLDRVVDGEMSAIGTLLEMHRMRLHRMVRMRIDDRLAARLDASDVVQDALVEAHRLLPDYAAKRPIPFYPWLRQLAWVRLLQMYRRHMAAQRRSVLREDRLKLSSDSENVLAERLTAGDTPSEHLMHQEIKQRVRSAIAQLPVNCREVIVLRHLEDLSAHEAAATLGISNVAFYSRYYRAIKRLHAMLDVR